MVSFRCYLAVEINLFLFFNEICYIIEIGKKSFFGLEFRYSFHKINLPSCQIFYFKIAYFNNSGESITELGSISEICSLSKISRPKKA